MTMPRISSAYRLIVSQGLNAFGDHCSKIVVASLVAASFEEKQASVLVGAISILYILPYVLLGPVVGRLSGRFSKSGIVKGSLLLQTFALAGLSASAWLGSIWGVMASLSLVAAQSCFLAPARNALLKELAGAQRIGQMMGLIGMAGVGATLLGLSVGGAGFDFFWNALETPWESAAVVSGVAAVFSFVSFVTVSRIRDTMAKVEETPRFIDSVRTVFRTPGLRWASLGLGWFYGVGTFLVMILLQDGRWDHEGAVGSASQGGYMAAILGAGVAIGSGIAAYVCRRRIEVGLAFVGALGLLVMTPITALGWESDLVSTIGVLMLGLCGGLFSAPLNALFVAQSKDGAESANIAVNNMLINLVCVAFALIGSLLGYLAWSPESQLWVVAATSVIVVGVMTYLVPESLIRVLMLGFVRVFYRLNREGLERLPAEGGALIVSNHVSYADALLLYATAERPVRFVGTDEMLKYSLMRWVYRRFKVVAVSPSKAKEAVSKTVEALKSGEVVCLFPEGALTRTGMIMGFKRGAELIARLAQVPVVPAHIDGMWGSVFSFSDKPFRFRWSTPMRRAIRISFGESAVGSEVTTEWMRERILDLESEAYGKRAVLKRSLGSRAFEALRLRVFRTVLVDRGMDGKSFRGVTLMGAGVAVQRYAMDAKWAKHVGVLLPPGLAGFATNLGLAWSGRVTVNLNPTVSAESFRGMLEDSGVDVVVSSAAFLKRFPELPLAGVKVVDVAGILREGMRVSCLAQVVLACFLPRFWGERMLGISQRGGDREASLSFSSGSAAEPKGIPLSHRNLLANATQLCDVYLMKHDDAILSNLPLFHSFGLTGGLWLPLLKGMKIVSYPSPLRASENVEAIREEMVSVLLGTPTFLRGYLKKADRDAMASVRVTIAGAEALSASLATQWSERFGSPILQGYGLTECSPVVSANCLHSRLYAGRYAIHQFGMKEGAVGRPLPGVRVRLVSLDDRTKVCPKGESGMIQVRGPNVIRGYLKASHGDGRFVDGGWFDTGDVGRMDADGFLSIEGRMTRFSKIGGEMVSHVAVEEAITLAFPEFSGSECPEVAVTGGPSERKGEELVLLMRRAFDFAELGKRMRAMGVPNLWIPQRGVLVERIPLLGTGKLDLRACQALALGSA